MVASSINKYKVISQLVKMCEFSIVKTFIYCVFIALCLIERSQSRIIDKDNRTYLANNDTLIFNWYDDVTAEKVSLFENGRSSHPTKHLAEHSDLYHEINGTLIMEATNFTSTFPDSIAWIESSSFVDTVFYSYQNHHNLIIRPDDIWTAIIVQLSLYVNANAEELRHSFVNFEGTKELEVIFVAPINDVPFETFIEKIITLIDDNIDPSISHWISPNFTTTTQNDKITAGVALMATLQKYFEYQLSLVLCGIPQVTILGNVEDWKEIRKRVDKLNEFELDGKDVMEKWSTMLGKILDQFVSVKEGNEKDNEFWRQALRVDNKTVDLGCASYDETFLNGWITAFSAFDKSGLWQDESNDDLDYNSNSQNKIGDDSPWLSIRTDKLSPGIVQAPIKIYDEYAEEDERHYTGAIITGHMGYSVKKDEKTVQPMSGWAMAITNKPPRYLKYLVKPKTL